MLKNIVHIYSTCKKYVFCFFQLKILWNKKHLTPRSGLHILYILTHRIREKQGSPPPPTPHTHPNDAGMCQICFSSHIWQALYTYWGCYVLFIAGKSYTNWIFSLPWYKYNFLDLHFVFPFRRWGLQATKCS